MEGYLGYFQSYATTESGANWGVLSGTPSSPGGVAAGISIDSGGGFHWVYPGGSSSFSTNRRYLKPHLLICDDFAMRDFTPQQSEDLYELVGERVRVGSTITTANRAPVDWYPLFPNPVLAEGILDRLLNSAHQILMAGRSYRPQQRPDRATLGREGALGLETDLVAETRRAESHQDARDDIDATNDTPDSDPEEVIASRPSRPNRGR